MLGEPIDKRGPVNTAETRPIHQPPRRALPLAIAVGGAETESWIDMSRNYAQVCADNGIPNEFMELAGEDHFTITGRLADADGPLVPVMLRQMGLGG